MRTPASLLVLAALAAACTSPKIREAEGPLQVMAQHYGAWRPGADWAALRADYTPEGRILHMSSRNPGQVAVIPVDDWFAGFGSAIDEKLGFQVTIAGSRTTVYDRLATVWMAIEVLEHDQDAEPVILRSVEQASLVLGPDDRWRIDQIQYQDQAEGWPPPFNDRGSVFLSSGGEINTGLYWRVSSNSF